MRQNQLSVHSENILPIIKKWLYSEKDIFLRELISNASDAIAKLRVLQEAEGKISIRVDRAQKTVTISDNGIGMTEEEVEKYIAQIAFSGAEEFVAKHKAEKEPIIGHFGLGFYSAYMVAEKVEIETLSYLPDAKPVFWSCDGSSNYAIGPGKRQERGTDIILHLAEENREYLEKPKLRELLQRYSAFLQFPIDLEGEPLGNEAPLWLKSPADCSEQEYLAFYRRLFPLEPDPVFWIHLNVDYPFHLQGILYFPKIHRRFDGDTSAIKLFCNRVFVSENCKEILPDYLSVLRGAIDSPDIPLNVSRSYLQVDKNVRQLSAHISKKVSDRLVALYKTDRDKFLACWPEIETLVKLGLLQDPKFYDRIKEALIWKTDGGIWTTVEDYLQRAKETVFYAIEERSSNILALYKEKGLEILLITSPLDTAVIQYLEDKLAPVKFQRIDASLDAALLDPAREKTLLDAAGKTEASQIASFIRASLSQTDLEVEAKSLSSDSLAGVVVFDENSRRLRDYMTLTQGKSLLPAKKTFVVNTNNKLVQTIRRLQDKQPDLAAELSRQIYDLSLLSQKELDPAEVHQTASRQTALLEKLANFI